MNEFINNFLPLERELFLALNGSDSTMLDNVMWIYTGIFIWLPMILFIIYSSFRNHMWKEALFVFVAIVLVVLVSDQLSSSLFKPLFKRFRPTHHPDYMQIVDIVKEYRGGLYGFVSGHATNSFGLAVFISLLFKNRFITMVIYFWAILYAYTRIYIGVHFISDILAGMILGTLVGLVVYSIYNYARAKTFNLSPIEKRKSIYTQKEGNTVAIGIISYIACIILFGLFLS